MKTYIESIKNKTFPKQQRAWSKSCSESSYESPLKEKIEIPISQFTSSIVYALNSLSTRYVHEAIHSTIWDPTAKVPELSTLLYSFAIRQLPPWAIMTTLM